METEWKTTWASDWHEFEADVDLERTELALMIEKYFGERCPEFEPDCVCCQKWAAYDVLMENPFDKP